MGPTEIDRGLAEGIGRAIVALGHGCVRRVVMIGSRAQGRARSDSDLDLVVIVELPPGVAAWRGDDFAKSGIELQSALGPCEVRVDIRVRTTDRYAEAREVPGGVEWVAAHSGVTVFETPQLRTPVVRTTRANVRRELVSSWMHHAVSALQAFDSASGPRPPRAVANTAVERLIAAVLTHRGVAPHLDRDPVRYVLQIAEGRIRQKLESAIEQAAVSPRATAYKATAEVLDYLRQDPQQSRYLLRVGERFDQVTSTAG